MGIVCMCHPYLVFLLRTWRRYHFSAWLSGYPPACSLSRGLPVSIYLVHTSLCEGNVKRGEMDSAGTSFRFVRTDALSSQYRGKKTER